jgi:gamma-glutamylcyclotransferase (GGCT)/AIG2-like uncharacterized protein YtfP
MLLFVYGTLKSGHRNNHYLENATLVDNEAETKECYRLFENGKFPALVPDGDGYSVEGELWDVPDEDVEEIDLHEALYDREFVEMKGDHDGEEITAYIFRSDLNGFYECFGIWG